MKQWFVALVVGALLGCTDTTPQKPPPVVEEPAADQPAEKDTDALAQPADDAVSLSVEQEPIAEQPAEAAAPDTPDEPADLPAQRVLLFTPDGPLLLHVAIAIDGEPHESAVAEFGRLLVAAFDADRNGAPRWDEMQDEVIRNRLAGITGQAIDDDIVDNARRFYDADGDGRVDTGEAIAWLERDSGMDRPRLRLDVLGRRAFEPDPRGAPAWRLLDTDADGSLSSTEIASAGQSLRGRDVNDDLSVSEQELLGLEDLLIRREALVGADVDTTRRGLEYRAGYVLRTPRDTLDVRDAFALLQIGQDYVDRSAFGKAQRFFDRLDADGTGFLLNTEWENLLSTEATIVARVELGAEAEPEVDFVLANPGDTDPEIAMRDDNPLVCELDLPRGTVVLAVSDAGVAEDGAFSSLSAAAVEGPLDQAAYDSLGNKPRQASFAALDLNSDQQITSEEVRQVRQALTGRQRLSVGLTVAAGEDPIFATLDSSGDGRLGEREIANAAQRLSELAGADRVLQPTEAPWRMLVTIHRGAPREVAIAGQTADEESAPPPVWFRGADYNRDGVVSRAEHVGSSDVFVRLDTDGDGFIDAAEARAASPPE